MIEVMVLMLSESVSYDKAGKRPSAFVSFMSAVVCPSNLNSLHSMFVQVYESCDLFFFPLDTISNLEVRLHKVVSGAFLNSVCSLESVNSCSMSGTTHCKS